MTEFNGKKIRSVSDLMDIVADSEINKNVTVKAWREGKERSFTVKIAERPEQATMRPAPRMEKTPNSTAVGDMGFSVAEPNAAIRRHFDLEADVDRPVVVEVTSGSKAARAGLLPGDVILDVNRKETKKPGDVSKEMKSGKNTLRVARQGSVLFLIL